LNDPDLRAFYGEYKAALWFAKQMGSSSVMIDHEAYINYSAVKLGNLVKHERLKSLNKKSIEQARADILTRLRAVGTNLANITQRIYPDVHVWSLALKFNYGFQTTLRGNGEIRAVDFADNADVTGIIFYYMLRKASLENYTFKLIEGGENTVWYPKYSVQYSMTKLQEQEAKMESFLTTFPNNFALGAPMVFWKDFESDFANDDRFKLLMGNRKLEARFLEDLAPVFKDLLTNRQYIWIYPVTRAYHRYDPFETNSRNQRIIEFTDEVSEMIKKVKIDCQEEKCYRGNLKQSEPMEPDDTSGAGVAIPIDLSQYWNFNEVP
jgi:hypothetical protein